MGASFRSKEEIIELAGCDLHTIAPSLLGELQVSKDPMALKLDPSKSKTMDLKKIELDEKTFRFMLNQDAMATEKLSEGIRKFAEDIVTLENFIQKLL